MGANEAKDRSGNSGSIKPVTAIQSDHSELDQSAVIEGNILIGALSTHKLAMDAERESSHSSWSRPSQ